MLHSAPRRALAGSPASARRPFLLLAPICAVLGFAALAPVSFAQSDPDTGSPESAPAAAAALPPRLVFAHDIPDASPFYDTTGYYGSNQPLLITGSTGASLTDVYGQVKTSGLDGVAVDLFTDFSGMAGRLTAADSAGITVAPVVDTSLEPAGRTTAQIIGDVVAAVTSYALLAPGHTSAQQYNGKYVVWTYNDSYHLGQADWATISTQLAAAGVPISLYGDVGGQYIHNDPPPQSAPILGSLLDTFDQAYSFGPVTTVSDAATILAGYGAAGKPFAWTLRPEYLKVTGNAATGNAIGYEDAQGTGTLQSRWLDVDTKSLLTDPSQCRTAFVATWDDFSENSGIIPSTDMSWTQSEINAFCASQFKEAPAPFPDARQYLTVQQSGYLGGTVLLECTVINPTTARDYVYPVVQNLNSAAITAEFGGVCPPYSITRYTLALPVTAALLAQTQYNGVSMMKVYSTLKDSLSGNTLVTTSSPYTALFSTPAPAGGGQALYYSTASWHTTGYQPSGTLNISDSGVKTLSITPAGNGYIPRSLELLHDTRRAFISYGTGAVSNVVFTDLNRQADNRNDPVDHGCYLVREVTSGSRVIYSYPISVTHH